MSEEFRFYGVLHAYPNMSRATAKVMIDRAPDGCEVVIKPKTRSGEQNALLHALLQQLHAQCEFAGKQRSVNEWKLIMVSGHAIATNQRAEVVPGIEGEFLNLRESTAAMSVKRLSSLVEYVQAWAAMSGVGEC